MNFPDLTHDSSGKAAEGRVLTVEDVRALRDLLRSVASDLPDDERIELISALVELGCAAEAAQAELAADFDASMRAKAAAAGVRPTRQGRGVAAQVAFARRESLARGERFLQLAKTVREMPHTRAAWRDGVVQQWTVTELMKGRPACPERIVRRSTRRSRATRTASRR